MSGLNNNGLLINNSLMSKPVDDFRNNWAIESQYQISQLKIENKKYKKKIEEQKRQIEEQNKQIAKLLEYNNIYHDNEIAYENALQLCKSDNNKLQEEMGRIINSLITK
tara:strand:+ start:357 stop:683 length:327 start_codon:yes stop_codon:yes gene_type:complete